MYEVNLFKRLMPVGVLFILLIVSGNQTVFAEGDEAKVSFLVA